MQVWVRSAPASGSAPRPTPSVGAMPRRCGRSRRRRPRRTSCASRRSCSRRRVGPTPACARSLGAPGWRSRRSTRTTRRSERCSTPSWTTPWSATTSRSPWPSGRSSSPWVGAGGPTASLRPRRSRPASTTARVPSPSSSARRRRTTRRSPRSCTRPVSVSVRTSGPASPSSSVDHRPTPSETGAWAILSPEVYLLLVEESGWSLDQYETWMSTTLASVLPRS